MLFCFFVQKNGDGQPCEKCPQCYTFSVMSKLSKIANHPELIKLDSKYRTTRTRLRTASVFVRWRTASSLLNHTNDALEGLERGDAGGQAGSTTWVAR